MLQASSQEDSHTTRAYGEHRRIRHTSISSPPRGYLASHTPPAIINTSFGSRFLQSAGRSLLLRRLQFFLPVSNSLELCFFIIIIVLLNCLGFKCPWAASAPRSLAGLFLSSFCSRYIKLFLKIDEECERGITMQAIDGFVARNSQAF